jgi:hypothetical protein
MEDFAEGRRDKDSGWDQELLLGSGTICAMPILLFYILVGIAGMTTPRQFNSKDLSPPKHKNLFE